MSLFNLIQLWFYRMFKNTEFIIEVKNSQIKYVSGMRDKRFINDCKDIVKANGLINGIIYGLKDVDGNVQLKTSSGVPAGVAQRLRNIWSFYS